MSAEPDGDLDALGLEQPLLDAEIDRRLVAGGQPVEHESHGLGGMCCIRKRHRQQSGGGQ
jgi:hypothetical protein